MKKASLVVLLSLFLTFSLKALTIGYGNAINTGYSPDYHSSCIANIHVNPSSVTICLGNTVTLVASGGASYVWSTGATTSSITVAPMANSSYTVVGIDSIGCTDSVIVFVTIDPSMGITLLGSNHVCKDTGDYCTTIMGGTPPFKYQWTVSNGAITGYPSPDSSCVFVTWTNPDDAGIIYVKITDAIGCTIQDSMLVRTCMTRFCGEDSIQKDSNFAHKAMAVNSAINQYIATHPVVTPTPCGSIGYVIPVVVHIISNSSDPLYLYESNGGANPDNFISYAQVQSAIDALNTVYTSLGVGDPNAANPQITFCLAHTPIGIANWYVDHLGNTEYGVERYIGNSPTIAAAATTPDMLNSSQYAILTATGQWNGVNYTPVLPASDYLNIYVVNNIANATCASLVCGYSPTPLIAGVLDGVVIRADVFGDNSHGGGFQLIPVSPSISGPGYGAGCATSDPNLNLQDGHVLCHETGHYLNVYHPFQPDLITNQTCVDPNTPGCVTCTGYPINNSINDGDFCPNTNATPPPVTTYFGGPLPAPCCINCPPVQVQNYMYYSTDNITSFFTNDQIIRMHTFLSLYRSNLFSVTNLTNTGVANPITGCMSSSVYSDFSIPVGSLCINTSYTFTPLPPPTNSGSSFVWNFGPNAVPSTITTTDVPVNTTFTVAGTYTVTLTVDGNCTSSQIVTINACSLDPNYLYNAQWYYGQYANIDFSSGQPVVTNKAFFPSSSPAQTLVSWESGSSYTNPSNITTPAIFTDGIGVWEPSSPGYPIPINTPPLFPTSVTNLNTWTCANQMMSSNYGLMTIPDPTTPGGYYIFTSPANQDALTSVRYATVSPLAVVSGPFNLSPGVSFSEGLTIIPHCNGKDYWIIAHTNQQQGQNNFYVYLLSQLGVNTTPIISPNFTFYCGGLTSLKASADSKHIALSSFQTQAALYDFDNSTGLVSNERIIHEPTVTVFLGASFNSNAGTSQYLFLNDIVQIYQYNFISPTPITTIPYNGNDHMYMQLGPDDNIYLPAIGKTVVDQVTGCNSPNPIESAYNSNLDYSQIPGYQYNPTCNPVKFSIYNQNAAPDLMDAIMPPPVAPTISVNYTTCSCVQFDVPCMGGYNFSWNFGCTCAIPATSNAPNPSVCYSTPGTYTVTCTLSIPGSPNTIIINQTVNIPAANITISGPAAICIPNANPVTYSVIPLGNGATYNWTTSAGTILTGQGTSSILMDWGGAVGLQTVSITVVAGGCTVTGTYTVNLTTGPTVTIGPVIGVCSGGNTGSATANASGGAPPYTYSWSTVPIQTNSTATGLSVGVYTVSVSDISGCSTTASATITQPLAILSASITASTNITCVTDGSATVIATGGTPGYTYLWAPIGGTNATANNFVSGGTYTVTVTDANGCTATASVVISSPPPLTLTLTTSDPQPIYLCSGAGSSETINVSGANNYSWAPAAGLNTTIGPNVIATPTVTTTYTVTGTTFNCTGTSTITINVLANCCTASCSGGSQTINGGNSISFGSNLIGWGCVAINGTFIVNNNFSIFNCPNVAMGVGAILDVQSGSTLTIINSRLWACGNMWQGIILEPGANLVVTNSIIEDAIKAVYAKTGSNGINISSNSKLNDNYEDIFIDPETTGYQLFLSGSSLTCASDGSYSSGHLKAPYSGAITYAGVYLNQVQGGSPTVTVGTPGVAGSANSISNMTYGVYSNNSDFNVYNNDFANITGPNSVCITCPITGVSIYGIAAFTPNTPSTYRHSYIGGPVIGGLTYANNFNQCYWGVLLDNYVDLAVLNNGMLNTTNVVPPNTPRIGADGVYVDTKYNTRLDIENNSFVNFATAIHLIRTYAGVLMACNNNINDNSMQAAGTGVMNYGILAEDAILQSLEGMYALVINNNTVKFANNCVFLRNIYDEPAYVTNSPLLRVTPATASTTFINPRAGVEMDDCLDLVQVANNPDIDANTTYIGTSPIAKADTDVIGIYSLLSPGMQIACNNIFNVGQGMRYEGNCTGQQIWRNTIASSASEKCYDGFVLWKLGQIGTQGNLTTPSGIVWGTPIHFVHSATYNYNSPNPAVFSRLFLVPPYPTPDLSFGLIAISAYYSLHGFYPASGIAPVCPGAPPAAPVGLQPQLNAFVKDSVPFPIFIPQSRYLTKQYSLEEINRDTSLMIGDTILQNFNIAAMPDNMGSIYKTMQYIGQGNFVSANAVNSGITPNNTIEQYHKAVNDIYLHTIAAGIDTADTLQLAILHHIAKQCPLTDGRAVFMARSMLNYFLHASLQFSDSCTGVGDTNEDKRVLGENKNSSSNTNILVYPNPANATLNVQLSLSSKEVVSICLYNSIGEVVRCETLKSSLTTIHTADLANGLYYYRITDNAGKVLKADKQVLIH